jgi:hypothetical protein
MRAKQSKRGPETKRVHESKDTPRPVTVTAGVRGEAPPLACCTSCEPANVVVITFCVCLPNMFSLFSSDSQRSIFYSQCRRLSSTIDAHIPTGMTPHMRTHRQAPHAHALYTSPSFHPRPTRVIPGLFSQRYFLCVCLPKYMIFALLLYHRV